MRISIIAFLDAAAEQKFSTTAISTQSVIVILLEAAKINTVKVVTLVYNAKNKPATVA